MATTSSTIIKDPKASGDPADGGNVEKPHQRFIEIAAGSTGAALVAYFAYRLARRKDDRSNFLAAASKFRAAFAQDIATLQGDHWGGTALQDMLLAAYQDRHVVAVQEFEPHIRPKRLAAFREDWNRYRYGEKENGQPATPDDFELGHKELLLLCYAAPGTSWETHIQDVGTRKALRRLQKLMEHARE